MWTDYVDTITDTTSSVQIWKTIRGMDGRRPPSKDNEVLQEGETAYVEDKDKAEEFAKTYKSFAKLPVKKEDRPIRRKNRKHMKRKPTVQEECKQAFMMVEIERVFKNLGPNAKELLLHL